jgi:putative methyltransferase (TIGR04325 family)
MRELRNRHALGTLLYGGTLRNGGRRVLGPHARAAARRIRGAIVPDVEYVPEGWLRETNDATVLPSEVNEALQVQGHAERWPGFVRAVSGPGPLGINHEVPVAAGEAPRTDDLDAHNTVMCFAYVVALTARQKDTISILDWGGAIGQYCALARAVVPQVAVDYACKDAPELCAHGRAVLPDATFYEDDSCFDRQYDLVVASGSLALSEDWRSMLARLACAARDALYVARLPIVFDAPSFVTLQRAYSCDWNVASLQWALNRREFLSAAADVGLTLRREFLSGETTSARGAPEGIDSRHFLFAPPRGGSR